MSDEVVTQMPSLTRKYFLNSHKFYVEQAQKRLLSQFENMEQEAKKFAEEWIDKNDYYFDPDIHDPADIYDQANDEELEFFLELSELKDQVRLSIVAGMYHKWEKQLREWLVNEARHWNKYEILKSKIWLISIADIFDMFEKFGWNIFNEQFYKEIDACRLVVNVFKHGNGNSLNDLKQKYPEYIVDPLQSNNHITNREYLDYTNLELSDKQLQEFSDAITGFWESIPDNIFISQINSFPKWLEKILGQDAL